MQFISSIKKFLRDEEGAQVVEYALIIALVSVGLAVAFQDETPGIFSGFFTKVEDCLAGDCTPPAP